MPVFTRGFPMGMDFHREAVADLLDRGTRILVVVAASLCIVTLILRSLVHFPIIDETNHAHYLWMISEGLKPGPDFFCAYPILYYLFLAPFFKMFPETAYTLLVLRFISVILFFLAGSLLFRHGRRVAGDGAAPVLALLLIASFTNIGPFLVEFSVDHAAALLAVAAMTLMFRLPTFRCLAAVSALSLLSVAVTPKYAIGLFFGLMGYIAANYLKSREPLRTLAAVGMGGAAAALVVLVFYWGYGISMLGNFKSAVLLNMRIVPNLRVDVRLFEIVLNVVIRHPLFGAVVFLGLAGWVKRSWRRPDGVTLAGAGILLGTILFCVKTRPWYEQYQAVVYISLTVFAPFAFTWFKDTLASNAVRCAFAVSVLTAVSLQVPLVAREFQGTNIEKRDTAKQASIGPPALGSLSVADFLLKTIPRDERVAAVWLHHPMFRRDLTPVSMDDRPSLSSVMDPGDPAKPLFDPEFFRDELSRRPPALIDLAQMALNYPPGWVDVAQDFLTQNESLYSPMRSLIIPEFSFFVRKDLRAPGP